MEAVAKGVGDGDKGNLGAAVVLDAEDHGGFRLAKQVQRRPARPEAPAPRREAEALHRRSH
jgi:hypothetical protein